MRNRGVLRVGMQFLEQMLHLPEGHRIIAAREADGFTDTIEVLVEGPDLPVVNEGSITPRVNLTVTVTETDEIGPRSNLRREIRMIDDLEFKIARLDLQPGDILVLKCKQHLPREACDRIRDMMKNVTAGHKTIVLDGGLEIAILTAAEIAERAA